MTRIVIPNVHGPEATNGQMLRMHREDWNGGSQPEYYFDPVPEYKVTSLKRWPLNKEPGWTAYIYHHSGEFSLKPNEAVLADLLLVGGGGSGGGGTQGGGGGAGGVLDLHDITIVAGDSDGWVTVGDGGPTVIFEAGIWNGHIGGGTEFGHWAVFGGGYGGSEGGGVFYHASGGGSGGGDQPYALPPGESWQWWYDHGCTSYPDPWVSYGGLSIWYSFGTAGQAYHPSYGHAGGRGMGYTSWYNRSSGGGGGAWFPATNNFFEGEEMSAHKNGGMGRPCDIGGWYQMPGNTELEQLYREAGWRYVPWYGGGGAGKERPNSWGYRDGHPGYGGGGDVGSPGENGKGGGGGGNGRIGESGSYNGAAGGDGIAIIRIKTCDESRVAIPYPTGIGEDGVPTYPPGDIEVRRIPANEPHTDEMGMEPATLWGFPDPAEHDNVLPLGAEEHWGDL